MTRFGNRNNVIRHKKRKRETSMRRVIDTVKKALQCLMALSYVVVIATVLILVQFGQEGISEILNLKSVGQVAKIGLPTVIYMTALYIVLRIITSKLSADDKFFCGVKLGRIRSMMMNGKIVRYFAHLLGLTGEVETDDPKKPYQGPVHIDEKTGEILPGKEVIFSFWWIFFGVRFIGFNSMKDYTLKKKVQDANGKLVEKEFTAKSLHFSDTYYYQIDDQETSDGMRADLTTAVTLQTVHAGESMKYNDWLDAVNPSVIGMSKEYVRSNTMQGVLDDENELSDETDSYIGCMRQLNNSKVGNISLGKKAGQRVIAASIEQVAFENAVAEALEAEKVAEAQGKAEVARQKALADSKEEEARGLAAIWKAENDNLERRSKVLKGLGGERAARVEISRNLSDGVKGFGGKGLMLGGNVLGTMGLDDEGKGEGGKKKDKPKPESGEEKKEGGGK